MNKIKRRFPYVSFKLMIKARDAIKSGQKVIKTYSRSSTIIPEWIGLTFLVYNGKKFIPVSINNDMIGKKLGEFSITRTFNSHS